MSKPTIWITAWRELGDDEDCLDVRMVSTPGYELFQAIATDNDIAFDAETDDTGFLVTSERSIDDGQVIVDETGKWWRVRFEEVANA